MFGPGVGLCRGRWVGAEFVRERLAAQLRGDEASPYTQQAQHRETVSLCPSRYLTEADFGIPLSARQLVCPSGDLPVGHVRATPDGRFFAVRFGDGSLAAYENRCAHRGARLIGLDTLATRITCPYHAWHYGMDGVLKKAPRVDDDVVKGKQLRRVAVEERAGAVWVCPQTTAKSSKSAAAAAAATTKQIEVGDVDAALGDVIGPPTKSVAKKVFDVKANWKLCVETFLEGYHVPSLHPTTLAKVARGCRDGVSALLGLDGGANSAIVFPLSTFDENDRTQRLFDAATGVFFLYPNAAVSVSPRFCIWLAHRPVAADRTIVTYFVCPRTDRDAPPDADQVAEKDFLQTVPALEEDYDCVEHIQAGLHAKAHSDPPEDFLFTHHEASNVAFLRAVERDLLAADESDIASAASKAGGLPREAAEI